MKDDKRKPYPCEAWRALDEYLERHKEPDPLPALWADRKKGQDRFKHMCLQHDNRGTWIGFVGATIFTFALLAGVATLHAMGWMSWTAAHPYWFWMAAMPVAIAAVIVGGGALSWMLVRCYDVIAFERCAACKEKYLEYAYTAHIRHEEQMRRKDAQRMQTWKMLLARPRIVKIIRGCWGEVADSNKGLYPYDLRVLVSANMDMNTAQAIFEEIAKEAPGFITKRLEKCVGGKWIDVAALYYIGVPVLASKSEKLV